MSDVGPPFPTRQQRNTPQAGQQRRQQCARALVVGAHGACESIAQRVAWCCLQGSVGARASELTPGLERLAAASFMSLLAPWQMPSMLDRGDAKEALEIVVEKITTRAERRKHEAAIKRSAELEAAALEEQAKPAWQPRQGCQAGADRVPTGQGCVCAR